MIPKIIHYCWYGNKNSQTKIVKDCINSWCLYFKNWEFIEWNEGNSDLSKCLFAQKMLKQKKYAFVSDYIRLMALYQYGGVYLDTDVMVFKAFNDLLNDKMILGFMWDCLLSTAVICVEPYNQDILNLLNMYEQGKVYNQEANNKMFTKYFLDRYPSIKFNNKYQKISDITIYPKEVFEFPSIKVNYAYSRHMYENSWTDKRDTGVFRKLVRKVLGDGLYFKIAHDLILVHKTPYFHKWLKDKYKFFK